MRTPTLFSRALVAAILVGSAPARAQLDDERPPERPPLTIRARIEPGEIASAAADLPPAQHEVHVGDVPDGHAWWLRRSGVPELGCAPPCTALLGGEVELALAPAGRVRPPRSWQRLRVDHPGALAITTTSRAGARIAGGILIPLGAAALIIASAVAAATAPPPETCSFLCIGFSRRDSHILAGVGIGALALVVIGGLGLGLACLHDSIEFALLPEGASVRVSGTF